MSIENGEKIQQPSPSDFDAKQMLRENSFPSEKPAAKQIVNDNSESNLASEEERTNPLPLAQEEQPRETETKKEIPWEQRIQRREQRNYEKTKSQQQEKRKPSMQELEKEIQQRQEKRDEPRERFQKPRREDRRDERKDYRRDERRNGKDFREQRERQQQERQRNNEFSISVVIPLFNEEESLRELSSKLKETLSSFNRYEIIFIDDGSTDNSANILRQLRNQDHHIKYIRFRRNYGKSAALSVGFEHAKGDIVITMDADLQDEPSEIPKLISKIKEGNDLVSGWKKKRYDPVSKTAPSKFFNFITSLMSGVHLHDFNCGLKAYKSEVAKSLEIYGELHRYIPVLAFRNGYKVTEEVVVHRPRKFGKSKFGASRFWRGFFDLLTVLFTTKYFRRPLHFFGTMGAISTTLGFIINAKLTYDWFHNEPLSNRPLLFVGILLMIVGVQLFSTGLIGDMITKSHSSSPREYAIREKHL